MSGWSVLIHTLLQLGDTEDGTSGPSLVQIAAAALSSSQSMAALARKHSEAKSLRMKSSSRLKVGPLDVIAACKCLLLVLG